MPESSADFAPLAATASCPKVRPSAVSGAATSHMLDAIYRRERRGLQSYLKRHVGSEAAGDLAHEVFLRAACSPQLLDLANPAGFLHRIARNLLIDRARRRRRDLALLSSMDEWDPYVAAEPERELIALELGVLLADALDALPGKTRRVFEMSRVENMTYRQIHRELGISVATVEYHMMKALARLREVVELYGCAPPDEIK